MRFPSMRSVLALEGLGFACLAILLVMNEWLDLPNRIFGAPATPWRPGELTVELTLVALLALAIIGASALAYRRLAYLESLLILCAECQQVSADGVWMRFEEFVAKRDHLETTHGICPSCARQFGPAPGSSGAAE